LLAHPFRNLVPPSTLSRLAIFERVEASAEVALIPTIKGAARNSEPAQRRGYRKIRALDDADELHLLARRASSCIDLLASRRQTFFEHAIADSDLGYHLLELTAVGVKVVDLGRRCFARRVASESFRSGVH
jgi:hypothetical protein